MKGHLGKDVRRAVLAIGLCGAVLLAMGVYRSRSAAAAGMQTPAPDVLSAKGGGARIVEINIDGIIQPILAEFISSAFDEAASSKASLILITMNTPGGLDTSMRQIIQRIISSPVPVVVYVSPSGSRAASAGFYILLSTDIAAMAPGTDTGAASPIFMVGGTPIQIDETLKHKAMNEAAAYLRSISERRGRNVELAEKAVTEAKAYSASEALSGNLIDLIAGSTEELLAKLDGRTIKRFDGTSVTLKLAGAVRTKVEVSAKQRFLGWLAQPDLLFILLIVGILGLYVEFTHPGLIFPGVLGGIALLLFLTGAEVVPLNMLGILLIAGAVVLFVMEAKVTSHGALALAGVLAMLVGALILVRSPITGMGVSIGVALSVTLPFALITVFVMRLAIGTFSLRQTTGTNVLVGAVGEVREAVDGTGMVFVKGELWRAAATVKIPPGAHVRVERVDGLTLQVVPLEGEEVAATKSPAGGQAAH
jgi:membrane-bound serine protease (ClpP class)